MQVYEDFVFFRGNHSPLKQWCQLSNKDRNFLFVPVATDSFAE